MISVYIGDTESININNKVFDKGTPTYVEQLLSPVIKERDDFEEYDSTKDYSPSTRVIHVNMPSDLELFLGALFIIRKLKSLYPLSPFKITCSSELTFLLPKGMDVSNYVDISSNNQIYRYFDLHLPKRKKSEVLNQLKDWNYEQVLLNHIGLFDTKKDYEIKPEPIIPWSEGAKRSKIGVVLEGSTEELTWIPFAQTLKKANFGFMDIDLMDKSYRKGKRPEQLFELFKQYKYLIFCGDTPHSVLARYAGCEVYAVYDVSSYHKGGKYKQLGIKGGPLGVPGINISELVPKLIEKMQSLSSASAPPEYLVKDEAVQWSQGYLETKQMDEIGQDKPKKKKRKKSKKPEYEG